MKTKLLITVASAGIFLASCNPLTPTSVTAQIQAIQQATLAICNFLPQTAVVAQVLAPTQAAAITGVTQIAEAICQAVTPQKAAAKRGATIRAIVNGVTITGQFVY